MDQGIVEKSLGGDPTIIPSYDEAREKFSRDYLANNLQRTAGNVTQAARLAKRTRTISTSFWLDIEYIRTISRLGFDRRKNPTPTRTTSRPASGPCGKDPFSLDTEA